MIYRGNKKKIESIQAEIDELEKLRAKFKGRKLAILEESPKKAEA